MRIVEDRRSERIVREVEDRGSDRIVGVRGSFVDQRRPRWSERVLRWPELASFGQSKPLFGLSLREFNVGLSEPSDAQRGS